MLSHKPDEAYTDTHCSCKFRLKMLDNFTELIIFCAEFAVESVVTAGNLYYYSYYYYYSSSYYYYYLSYIKYKL